MNRALILLGCCSLSLGCFHSVPQDGEILPLMSDVTEYRVKVGARLPFIGMAIRARDGKLTEQETADLMAAGQDGCDIAGGRARGPVGHRCVLEKRDIFNEPLLAPVYAPALYRCYAYEWLFLCDGQDE